MRIQARQRGGFAGIPHVLVDIDTVNLGPSQAADVERLASEIQTLGGATTPSAVGADFLTYDITVHEPASQRTLTIVDDGSATALRIRSLLEQLSSLAQGADGR